MPTTVGWGLIHPFSPHDCGWGLITEKLRNPELGQNGPSLWFPNPIRRVLPEHLLGHPSCLALEVVLSFLQPCPDPHFTLPFPTHPPGLLNRPGMPQSLGQKEKGETAVLLIATDLTIFLLLFFFSVLGLVTHAALGDSSCRALSVLWPCPVPVPDSWGWQAPTCRCGSSDLRGMTVILSQQCL